MSSTTKNILSSTERPNNIHPMQSRLLLTSSPCINWLKYKIIDNSISFAFAKKSLQANLTRLPNELSFFYITNSRVGCVVWRVGCVEGREQKRKADENLWSCMHPSLVPLTNSISFLISKSGMIVDIFLYFFFRLSASSSLLIKFILFCLLRILRIVMDRLSIIIYYLMPYVLSLCIFSFHFEFLAVLNAPHEVCTDFFYDPRRIC